jgi:TRAP-type C4-dicarboxylate transport system substrate-binding protein
MKLTRRLLGLGLAALIAAPGMAAAEPLQLRMANWLPSGHFVPQELRAWADEVGKLSGGSIAVSIDEAPLAKPDGQYDLVRNGIVDMAWFIPGYTPGRFPMIRASELPFLTVSASAGSQALTEWYERNVGDREMKDVKLITAWTHGPGLLHSGGEVNTLEDLQGLKLRVGGGGSEIANLLGAVPVSMTVAETYEALQRGTTDGTFLPWDAMASFKLNDVTKYHLEMPRALYVGPQILVMNRGKWDALTPEQQGWLLQAGGADGAKAMGASFDAEAERARMDAISRGHEVITMEVAEFDRWAKKLSGMDAEWVAKATELGYDGEALLTDLRETFARYNTASKE